MNDITPITSHHHHKQGEDMSVECIGCHVFGDEELSYQIRSYIEVNATVCDDDATRLK